MRHSPKFCLFANKEEIKIQLFVLLLAQLTKENLLEPLH
jgi:hypothetical protein